ncbi:MAG: SDR family oxidoreductase [Phycisphaerales bacterium]|nr:SDR family oxidoreductase [Phycisphaerales bacterium]
MPPTWLITGATGQLGGHTIAALSAHPQGRSVIAITHRRAPAFNDIAVMNCDLADSETLRARLDESQPDCVVHLGAVTAVGSAYGNPGYARRVNTDATRILGEWCAAHNRRLVFVSTDMVFDGESAPYSESAVAAPLSQYGRTKADAERAIAHLPGVLTVRLPLMYGFSFNSSDTTFAKQIAALRAGDPLNLFTDEYRTPVALADAARALVVLAASDLTGVIHVAGPERLSRYAMVERFAAALEIPHPKLVPISRLSIAAPEPRPADLSLDGRRFADLFTQCAPRPISPATLVAP